MSMPLKVPRYKPSEERVRSLRHEPEEMVKSGKHARNSSRQAQTQSGFIGEKADEYAQKYADESPAGFALRVRRERVLELFDKPGGKVLDVGCGPAEMVQPLLDLGCEFWGVDPSARMIEICQSRFGELKNAHFVLGEASRLVFSDNSFDAVLCMGVIDSLVNLDAAIGEMLRVLKPGGTLIATFANRASPYVLWKAYAFYPAISAMRRFVKGEVIVNDPVFVRRRLFTPETAEDLLSGAGAEVLRVVGHFYNILLSPLDEILPAGTLRLNWKLEKWQGGRIGPMAAGFIVKASKREGRHEPMGEPSRGEIRQ
jgi:ubiquinone/menaquinone biosynthesis C-methylase UbiE